MSALARPSGNELLSHCEGALAAAREYARAAREVAVSHVMVDARVDGARANRHQRLLHGMAWVATTVEALAATARWYRACRDAGVAGAGEELVVRIGFGEYLHQLLGGIPMSQNELVRPVDLGLTAAAASLHGDPSVRWFLEHGNSVEARGALVAHLRDGGRVHEALGDETLDMVRDQFRRFTDERVRPGAQRFGAASPLGR